MRRGFVRSGAIAVGVLTLGSAGALAVPLSAAAVPGCVPTTPAATLISSTLCEIRVSTSGTYTFPTAITKLSAVLVGAGGGGYDTQPDNDFGYGGDGGSMTYIDTVALGTPVDISVGQGGSRGQLNTPASQAAGTSTLVGLVSAAGGAAGAFPDYAGAGAGGGPTGATGPQFIDANIVGPGLTVDAVATDAVLFPEGLDTTLYAEGGAGANGVGPGPSATSTTPGSGGAGYLAGGTSTSGQNGVVILRFAAVDVPAAPALAATGAETGTGLVAALGLLMVGGLALGRRRRSAS